MNIHVKTSHPGFSYSSIVKGVSAKAVLKLMTKGVLSRDDVFRVIPERTLMRRVSERVALKIEEADAIARLLRVRDTAIWAFNDAVLAERFLSSDNPALGGKPPRVLAATDVGAREVEALLYHFVFGDVG